jgi:hypothetical protein
MRHATKIVLTPTWCRTKVVSLALTDLRALTAGELSAIDRQKGYLMSKERACANGSAMSRRTLLSALPVIGVAATLPKQAKASDRSTVLAVISELENWQGWEPSSTVCAKAFAAYRLRQALGMDLPDPALARDHLYFQNQSWDSYKRTVWFERNQLEGKHYSPPLPVSAI